MLILQLLLMAFTGGATTHSRCEDTILLPFDYHERRKKDSIAVMMKNK